MNSLILCKKNNLNFECNFMGEWIKDEEKNYYFDLIKQNELKDNIHFYGLITDEKKWTIYMNNAVLIHPTFWDGQPLSILEAMGIGMTIISTKVGAIPETVINGHNGIILDENKPELLYKAIEKFYFDRKYLEIISRNNIDIYCKRFTNKIFLNNLKNWLEE